MPEYTSSSRSSRAGPTASCSGSACARRSPTRARTRPAPGRRPRPPPTGRWCSPSSARRGLYALDLDGKPLWEKDLGDMTVKLGFGEGSTPALCGDTRRRAVGPRGRVVRRRARQQDRQGALAAASATRGPRGRARSSSSTPAGPRSSPAPRTRSAATTPPTASCSGRRPGMTANAIPTPVHKDGVVFLTSGFRGNALLAMKLDAARGDISGFARDRLEARPRHALRAVAAVLRRRALLPEGQQRPAHLPRREDRRAALRARAAGGGRERLRLPARAPPGASTSRAATERPRCWSAGRRSSCSRRTPSTTASTRRRWRSTRSSTCAAASTSTGSRSSGLAPALLDPGVPARPPRRCNRRRPTARRSWPARRPRAPRRLRPFTEMEVADGVAVGRARDAVAAGAQQVVGRVDALVHEQPVQVVRGPR